MRLELRLGGPPPSNRRGRQPGAGRRGGRAVRDVALAHPGDREATIGSYYQGPNRDTVLAETHDYVDLVSRRQAALAAGG